MAHSSARLFCLAYQGKGVHAAEGKFYGGMFAGFVSGSTEVMWRARWIEPVSDYGAPLSSADGLSQAGWIVAKYLDDHPESWKYAADSIVFSALHAVWPGNVAAPSR